MSSPRVPQHVAIIMDGNGRWAKARGLPRLEGHRQGGDTARNVVRWASDAGVRQISLYAFSTENWGRPKLEVRGLMALLATLLPSQIPEMVAQGVRFRTLGDIAPLPNRARRAIAAACAATAHCRSIDLILCLNYGGRQEILAGVRQAAQWAMRQADPQAALASLSVEQFRNFLWCDDLLPVDLLIRTGGEWRISNFFLWDAAYAELYFTGTLWPDFSESDLQAALRDFAARERRFGLTSEQVA